MGIKEIITWISALSGLCIICYVRVIFSKRQLETPDNAYTPKEKKIFYVGVTLTAIGFILAAIPIY